MTSSDASLKPADYVRLARDIAKSSGNGELERVNLALLASSTLDLLRSPLVVEGSRWGLRLDLYIGPFGQLEQEVYEAGALYQADPDALVLMFQPGEIVPDLLDRYYATDGERYDAVCSDLIDRLIDAARKFRDQVGGPVLVANFATPGEFPLGPFDAGDPAGLTHRLGTYNKVLAEKIAPEPNVYVWDFAGAIRQVGTTEGYDPRLWLMARASVSSRAQVEVARHLARTLAAVRQRPAKCLVLDLDNTLWGGVVGDDGLEGIQLGDDWPGSAFKALQRAVLGLRDRGILLAVASKNDRSVAKQVFDSHPEMLLSWDDLAAERINWEPKSKNLVALAEELNIGLDSLAFFDDNPVERAEVRAGAPAVRVIEVPSDPVRYRTALLNCGHFDLHALSKEDRNRAQMYQAERARTATRVQAKSMDDFLEELEMVAEVGAADTETLGRIAQLVGRTNQFNLTTRRHSDSTLLQMSQSDNYYVGWLRQRDRFGDQGLVCVGILELNRDEKTATLDSFLMSCRVMNRGVERAMLAHLVEKALDWGCSQLVGTYIPTAKNHIVERFFEQCGFSPLERDNALGKTVWKLDLTDPPSLWPSHIHTTEIEEGA